MNCSHNRLISFAAGVLFGVLVVGLYITGKLAGDPRTDPAVQGPVVIPAPSCPAPVIDTPELASICMNWHHSPKQMAYKGSTKP